MHGPKVLRHAVAVALAAALVLSITLVPASANRARAGTVYTLPCSGKRFFTIHVQGVKRRHIVSVKISFNGRALHVSRGRNSFSARVDLRGLGRVTSTVRIVARTSSGKTISGKRIYHSCRGKGSVGSPAL